jgi:hypothetical protein
MVFKTRLATRKCLCVGASEWTKEASMALTFVAAVSVEDECALSVLAFINVQLHSKTVMLALRRYVRHGGAAHLR